MELSATAFADWYRAEHPRVLGALTALSGGVELAAEVTDEAFARALAHWSPRHRRLEPVRRAGGRGKLRSTSSPPQCGEVPRSTRHCRRSALAHRVAWYDMEPGTLVVGGMFVEA